jgi:hypothetical protein
LFKIPFPRGWGQEGEMTQALYAHMNNKKIKIKKKKRKINQKKKSHFPFPSVANILSIYGNTNSPNL